MDLAALKGRIETLYGLRADFALHEFLISERAVAEAYLGQRIVGDEQLLLRQDGEACEAALYLDAAVLEQLQRDDPDQRLHDGNLAAYCLAIEGISHLVHLHRHVDRGQPVSALELELVAEIEKYLLTLATLRAQQIDEPHAWHARLFDRIRYAPGLAEDVHDRYRHANFYAARYCLSALQRHGARVERCALRDELRWLAAQDRDGKLRYIRDLAP